MKTNSEAVFDTFETMLIMAMNADAGILHESKSVKFGKDAREGVALESLLRLQPILPVSCVTFDPVDGNRIFSMSLTDLLSHPAEILGDLTEVMCVCNGTLKWMAYKATSRPKYASCLGAASHWYEIHFRTVDIAGKSTYNASLIALSKAGKPLPVKAFGEFITSKRDAECIILSASAVEDYHRSGVIRAEISEGTAIKFTAPMGSQSELFAIRDNPLTPAGKRRAILHWVQKHMRKTKKAESPVKAHFRGVKEFEVDGMSVRLLAN